MARAWQIAALTRATALQLNVGPLSIDAVSIPLRYCIDIEKATVRPSRERRRETSRNCRQIALCSFDRFAGFTAASL